MWDDRAAVLNNPVINPTATPIVAFMADFWGSQLDSEESHKSYRPLTTVSYNLDVQVAGGKDPSQLHGTNIGIHAFVSVLVAVFAAHLNMGPNASFWAGLVYSVHPIHVDAVASVVGRAELLSALFVLLAAIVLLRAKQLQTWRRATCNMLHHGLSIFLACVLICVAGLCKETGLIGGIAIGCLVAWSNPNRRGPCATLDPGIIVGVVSVILVIARLSMNAESLGYKWTALETSLY